MIPPRRPSTADLRRKHLRIERRIRIDRPPAAPPQAPDGAAEVLAACAAVFQPGARVGVQEIAVAAGIKGELARAVRAWAKRAGVWPYRDALGGWQGHPGRRRGRDAKGGET
jgi:hypothetical protein